HPVHGRGALMDLADLVGLAGVIKNALGGGRLAGIDVRHDADVAILLERMAAGHDRSSSSNVGSRFGPAPHHIGRKGFQRKTA
nr:hypothetical protein [Tanacetum cinerariifolium]